MLEIGVLLDPGIDEGSSQPVQPPPPAALPSEPPATGQPPAQDPPVDPPANPEPAAPTLEQKLEQANKDAAEARRLAEFWANKAAQPVNPAPAPKATEPPAPAKTYTREEIADALAEGNADVLSDLGYVRKEDVVRIAEEVSQRSVGTLKESVTFEQRMEKDYGDYLDPEKPGFKLLAAEIQGDPKYKQIGAYDQNLALEMALKVVSSKAAQAPPPIDYDARINNQAPPTTRPAPSTNAVSTVATAQQIRTAEALGIPVSELLASQRELKGAN